MRSRTRKIKAIGLVGMLVTGLAAGGLPAEPVSAANGWEEDLSLYAKSVTASSVTISIDSSGNATLSPGRGANGTALGTVKRTASVQLGATDGYTIKVSGNPNLTGNNANNKIASVSSATTLKQMSNQWGWYSAEGDVSCDESGTYRAMSTAGETVSSGVLSSAATKTVTMCFGANVSTSQAADNYSNTVTVSAVAEPRTVVTSTKAFGGITYMQDMTVNACQNASVNETAQLIDRRDLKKYWVTKLLDGNCWMSQNLDFNIGTTVLATQNSDPSQTFTWTVGSNGGMTSISQTGIDHGTYKYAWDLGSYVITNPTAMSACEDNNTGMPACTGKFQRVDSSDGWSPSSDPNFYKNNGNKTYSSANLQYDAHYLVGNSYQWNTATADTGGTITNASAGGSICPKGWRLPNSGKTAEMLMEGSFNFMLQQYGLANEGGNIYNGLTGISPLNGDLYDIALSPLFYVRSGFVYGGSGKIQGAGEFGAYWSSRAYSNTSWAYELYFGSSIEPAGDGSRHYGLSIRCLFPTS